MKSKTMAQSLRSYPSAWIGQMVSGGAMAEWTCDGQSVTDEGTHPFNENLWSGLIEGPTERL